MLIDRRGRRGSRGRRGAERRGAALLAIGFLVAATLACGEAEAPGTDKPAAATNSGAPVASAAAAPEPKTVADIFPAGAQREAVMNSCGNCHNLACSAIGQRSTERWKGLEEGHKEKVTSGDVHAMFEYLAANFNASKPEPKVPPKFLEGGCTPF